MKVSIIITSYNRERFIGRAIRSAISQQFLKRDFEVIVVDDGSHDNSQKIIKDFGDLIIPIFHKKNKGLPSARNTGIRSSQGRYVIHLDSDDYIHENLLYIEEMHLAFNSSWGAVSCDYYKVDEQERHLEHCSAKNNPIACGIMFRKENLITVGLYDEEMLLCEDEELRIRYEKLYHIGNVNLPLYRYTQHSTNISNDKNLVQKFRNRIGLVKPSNKEKIK